MQAYSRSHGRTPIEWIRVLAVPCWRTLNQFRLEMGIHPAPSRASFHGVASGPEPRFHRPWPSLFDFIRAFCKDAKSWQKMLLSAGKFAGGASAVRTLLRINFYDQSITRVSKPRSFAQRVINAAAALNQARQDVRRCHQSGTHRLRP